LTHKYNLLLGGIGSGKTWTGFPWLLQKCSDSPKSLGLITANTYGQLQKATLTSLFKALSEYEIDFNYNKNTSILTVLGKEFICLSMENFDNNRGIEVGEWWGDEAAFYSKEAFDVMCGRLRDSRGKLDVLLTTTPNGFNYLHSYFADDGEFHDSTLYRYVKAKSKLNKFLPDGYIDSLMSQYDSKLILQELDGEFVQTNSGQIYWAFNRDLHLKDVSYKSGHQIYLGVDFNVNPMTAVFGQVYDDTLHIFDELFLKDSNTSALCSAIKAKYGTQVIVIPDSTGIKATTNSNRSDHRILKDAGFTVKSATNPFRIDRYASVNVNFEKHKIIIDNKCKHLIKDLEQVSFKEGTDKPLTTNSDLTHISDALGYLVFRTINPFKAKAKPIILG